jgi:hypothetical protein
MLTAVSTKRAGTTIECPVAPSIIFLAPRRLLVYSQRDTPGFLFLQTLSVCIAYTRITHILTSNDIKELVYARRFTADMYSVSSTASSRTSV